MPLDTWCLVGTSMITALVVSRMLATGREAALMAANQAKEEADAIRKQQEAVFEEMARASSDVDAM